MSLSDLTQGQNPWWETPHARAQSSLGGRRAIFENLWKAIHFPGVPRAQALLGPRQVGKSVLLKQVADRLLEGVPPGNITYFDFSDERVPRLTSLRDVVDFVPPGRRDDLPRFFLLDEITRASRWDLAIKQMVDRARNQPPAACDRFLVTDSAASLMREGMRDSMQGRVDEHRIEGLSFSEFATLQAPQNPAQDTSAWAAANAERYLSRGGLPEHLFAAPEVFDAERARASLRADIHDRAIGRDLSRRGIDTERVQALFVGLAQDSGGIFESAGRARDLDAGLGAGGTDARTVRAWLQILLETGLLTELPPRQSGQVRGSRHLKARPKVYVADHSMIAAFWPLPKAMELPDVRAKTLEAAVFRHLREIKRVRNDVQISFFREKERHALDFVLDSENRSLGVAVTTSDRPDQVRPAALAAAGRAKLDHLIVAHGGFELGEREKTTLVPWYRFLLDPQEFLGGL